MEGGQPGGDPIQVGFGGEVLAERRAGPFPAAVEIPFDAGQGAVEVLGARFARATAAGGDPGEAGEVGGGNRDPVLEIEGDLARGQSDEALVQLVALERIEARPDIGRGDQILEFAGGQKAVREEDPAGEGISVGLDLGDIRGTAPEVGGMEDQGVVFGARANAARISRTRK